MSRILMIDFGSQYAQLIVRRVRECGVYCELFSPEITAADLKKFNPAGIILSGGPETVTADHTPRAPQFIFEAGIPVLGICYGMQTMAAQLGGKVSACDKREFGYADVICDTKNPLFEGLSENFSVWMSHGDQVTQLPPGFQIMAKTNNAPIAAMTHAEKKLFGLQFHPEVTHTQQGLEILDHFVKKICGCDATWTIKNIITENIAAIRKKVGTEKVLLALSGGVDSSVLAALLHEAIGDQLICVFVDTGLLRKDEGDQVMRVFLDHMKIQVICVNAAEKFYTALKGIADPEEKRKTIGKAFIDVFDDAVKSDKRVGQCQFLAQGTIYPDVIESGQAGSGKSHTIKSHHNVGGLPESLPFILIEPLRELFKDEVRKVGLSLGLPRDMIFRHPFPGAGLGVRILGEVKQEYISILQQADNIFISLLREEKLYDTVSQAFAVFLPVKSVGVKGDARCYEYVIALRAVTTIDFMTAEWADLPHDFLARVSNKILNEVAHVSRVVYDISGKPPSTIEWE
ncbi:MAG: glutamine-hydrolyzing GMP synthase [Gammaproteobacteria bacterium RIFCSPHIGHO2_12_FULL_42_13]|nr:MAG: glutamine-hydrolyzing GMP synthase [Gammaproteobacteria bacterium RIFCSPHIGHO2_12_FULL_42_13]